MKLELKQEVGLYSYLLDETDRGLLLEVVGDAVDNEPDCEREEELNRLYDEIKSVDVPLPDDYVRSVTITSRSVGYAGNELMRVMRVLRDSEEEGRGQDAAWYTHELWAMVRGMAAAGWEVTIKPQPSGALRCVEIGSYVFKV